MEPQTVDSIVRLSSDVKTKRSSSLLLFEKYLEDKLPLEAILTLNHIKEKIDRTIDSLSRTLDLGNHDLSSLLHYGKLDASEWPENIRILILERCSLRTIPLLSNPKLLELHVSHNFITIVPDHLIALKNLRLLDLSHNQISNIPTEIFNALSHLKELRLNDNQIEKIPEEIKYLNRLQTLNVSRNNLKEIPYTLGLCGALEFLILDQNYFTYIPQEIGHLTNLRKLSLLGNDSPFLEIPDTIRTCDQLKDLIFSENQMFSVPKVLCIKDGGPALLRYLKSMKRYSDKFLYKGHWQRDSNSKTCTNCGSAFNAINRRHHCRLCGLLFDFKCAHKRSKVIPLGIFAMVRLCKSCFKALLENEEAGGNG